MKYVDEYRDQRLARGLLARLHAAARGLRRPVRIMEICGGHTVALCRAGIHAVLPPNVRVVSGPGCPVCVTPRETVDQALWLVEQPGVVLFSFGDMLRVHGARGTLGAHAGRDGRVRIMYSPLQAVEYAAAHPACTCVMLAVGFETTAPALAAAVISAAERGLKNFRLLSAGKQTPPAMRALLRDPDVCLDGFIAPGHVTTVIGAKAYQFIDEEFGKPCVVAGFEVCDLLDALVRVVTHLAAGTHAVEIEYTRSATWAGNEKAQAIMAQVFEPCEARWRGLGSIPASGYAVNKAYASFDVTQTMNVPQLASDDPPGCRCGDVLRGICTPPECPLFGAACTPDHAAGPCMVSSEGSCAAYYSCGVRGERREEQRVEQGGDHRGERQ